MTCGCLLLLLVVPSLFLVLIPAFGDERTKSRSTLMRPTRAVKLDRTRGVTWVHVIEGQWLLTATSDSSVSEVSLWDVDSLLAGVERSEQAPTATAYLPGPVHQGLVDVQDGRVTIALEIQSHTPYTEVVCLAKHDDQIVFERLATLPGVACIRCLSGNILGYAVDHELNIPSLVNWKTKRTTHFRDTPNLMGGCIAMSVRREHVAVLIANHVEIYTHNLEGSVETSSNHLLTQFALQKDVLDASLVFLAEFTHDAVYSNGTSPLYALRAILATSQGISVCDVEMAGHSEGWTVHETWALSTDVHFSRHRPSFGRSMNTITWFNIPQAPPWISATLTIATIPYKIVQSQSNGPDIHTLDQRDLPALHLASVWSYDERAGVLALGNACGELRLYRVHADTRSQGGSLSSRIRMPCYTSMDLLPASPLQSHVAPPYPHSLLASPILPPSYTTVGTPLCNELLAMWKSKQNFDRPIPAHWTSDFLHTEYDGAEEIQWWLYLSTMDGDSVAWDMERTAHHYGTLYLLLYCERDRVAIFEKGGLLFLYIQDTSQYLIARAGTTATGLALGWNEHQLSKMVEREIRGELVHSLEGCAFFLLGEWEKHKFGRNRWKELRARGGEVAPELLNEELYVPANHAR